jgi:nitroreductase
MDRRLLHGSWLDCGMFMANIMAVARAYGLETCAQQAWCEYGTVLRRELNVSDDHIILSGMSLGYADHSARENTLVTEREDADQFTLFHTR